MVKTYHQSESYTQGIGTSEFRRRLSHYIGRVRHGGDFVAIRRKGEENVYLISQADWDLLGRRITDLDSGKFDPAHRVRRGGLWELLNRESRAAAVTAVLDWKRHRPFRKTGPGAMPNETETRTPETAPAPSEKEARGRTAMGLVEGALARLEQIEQLNRDSDGG